MKQIFRGVRIALTLTIYFVFAPFGYAAFFIWSLLPTSKPERRAAVLQGIMRRAFLLMHDWIRGVDLIDCDPRTLEDLSGGKPAVFVANHPTLTDTTSLFAALPKLVLIVKPSLFHKWWAKPLLSSAGFFEGPGHELDSLARTIEDAQDRLSQGYRIMVFPEGTRSPEDGMHDFGRLAFEIACRANVPVYPILITCEPVWLSKEYPITKFPNTTPTLQLNAMEPVTPADVNGCSRQMRQLVQARFEESLGITHSVPNPQEEKPYGRIAGTQNQRSDRRVANA
jgi:1-acyl-sn-glycerol-3-phosphate acyltransferase